MEETFIGLAPQISNLSMGKWLEQSAHLSGSQVLDFAPMLIKITGAALLTLAFDSWKKLLPKSLGTHCEANQSESIL